MRAADRSDRLVDEEPFREGLSKWRALLAHRDLHRLSPPSPSGSAEAHFRLILELIERLRLLPAELREHTYSDDSFGSWTATLLYKGTMVRIVCDRREREVVVQRSASRKPPHTWEPVVRLEVAASSTLDQDVILAIEKAAG